MRASAAGVSVAMPTRYKAPSSAHAQSSSSVVVATSTCTPSSVGSHGKVLVSSEPPPPPNHVNSPRKNNRNTSNVAFAIWVNNKMLHLVIRASVPMVVVLLTATHQL